MCCIFLIFLISQQKKARQDLILLNLGVFQLRTVTHPAVVMKQLRTCWLLVILMSLIAGTYCNILTPDYFNLATGRRISATATCGEGVSEELYCRITGSEQPEIESRGQLIQVINQSVYVHLTLFLTSSR